MLIASSLAAASWGDEADQPIGATQGATRPTQTITADAGPSPYQLKLQYAGEIWDNVQGGLRTGVAYLQNVDASLSINTAKAFGWTGGRFYVEGFYQNSRSLDTQYVTSVQDPSVLDSSGVQLFRLYQAYYQQTIGNTDLLFGIYDPQTDFGNSWPMGIFMNGAYAWTTTLDQSGQQGLNGPSTYPNTALGFRVRQTLNSDWSVQAAIMDGMSDSAKKPADNTILINSRAGIFGLAEIDYEPAAGTKVMAGYWGYSSKFDAVNGVTATGEPRQVYGSNGGYIGGATKLADFGNRRHLDVFANFGVASSTVNVVTRTLNAGLSFTGPLADRPYDKMGLAFSIAGNGNPYRNSQKLLGDSVYSDETNVEFTYRAPITRWLTIQPDVQYWVHTGFDPMLKNDLLVGLHFEIGHLFNL